ncbi:hypothetical protein QMA60_09060 [Leuconostoc suionicum]|uniref:hypothetical protein n=1 Tax=Leuconostoc suionicum TaxID=1511761 RepID=UPI0024ADDCCF|nr:hypothetical protein [Leuconostoc suionicum]MDI6497890.1 hypothetical protein [Leuconostoc suionicum]MDI6499971.1 hypothetical protein [Leuconostoc suionicum]MDI6502908.1 hypothetical protein [Leuconostoc suionicum]MDI6665767.1 hypothetical protein [Leuconostoc suionicum]
MKKIIVPIVTGIISLIIGVIIGVRMTSYVYDEDKPNEQVTKVKSESESKNKSSAKTIQIGKTSSNAVWNVTLDKVTTKKIEKSDNESYTGVNDFNIKKLVPKSYYETTIEATLENKTDKDIDGSYIDGDYTLIDGDGNSRTDSGTTLTSYTDVRPVSIQKFTSKTKTKIQFVILSDKNNFNYKGIRISVPDFSTPETSDDAFKGGTFNF